MVWSVGVFAYNEEELIEGCLASILAAADRPVRVFVLINAWLATPLPFPVAAILVWTLPNLLAFPWTYPDYYRRVLDSALFSFPVSIALCVLIARRLFGASPVDRGAASAGHEMP